MQSEMRRCLEQCDVEGVRRLWAHVSPHLPVPKTDAETLAAIHHSRTQAESISLRLRAYSHHWLLDNGYPSGLPDRLKPSAEQLCPRVVDAVGISVNTNSELFRPIRSHVQRAMSDAVMDCYANGDKAPEIVKPQMFAARKKAVRQLLAIKGD